MIAGKHIYLRPPLPIDVPAMTNWENQPEIQAVSEHSGQFTQEEVRSFFLTAGDLFSEGQQRFIICLSDTHQVVGALDLFAFDKQKASAGIGILISPAHQRGKGYATDALNTMLKFALDSLGIHIIRCIIYPENTHSIRLFEKCHFRPVGMEFFKHKKAIRYERKLNQ